MLYLFWWRAHSEQTIRTNRKLNEHGTLPLWVGIWARISFELLRRHKLKQSPLIYHHQNACEVRMWRPDLCLFYTKLPVSPIVRSLKHLVVRGEEHPQPSDAAAGGDSLWICGYAVLQVQMHRPSGKSVTIQHPTTSTPSIHSNPKNDSRNDLTIHNQPLHIKVWTYHVVLSLQRTFNLCLSTEILLVEVPTWLWRRCHTTCHAQKYCRSRWVQPITLHPLQLTYVWLFVAFRASMTDTSLFTY